MLRKFVWLLLIAGAVAQTPSSTLSARMLSGVNYQSGNSYTFVAKDTTRVVSFINNVSPVSATLPSANSSAFHGLGSFVFSTNNLGSSTVTITCSSCTINGVSTLSLTTGSGADLYSDGTNYSAVLGGGGGGGTTYTGSTPIQVAGSVISCPTCSSVVGSVVTGPGVGQNQNVVQPPTTQLGTNNLSGVRYVSLNPGTFNWSKSLAGTVTGSTTVTFSPCPLGVFGSDANLYVTINNGAESDLISGGSCVPGSSGNIVFNVTGSYSNPTISSASSGIYEGVLDAETSGAGTARSNFRVVITPTNPPASTFYAVYAPIVIPNGIADIDGSGASIDCESLDQCFWFKSTGELTFHGFRFGTKKVTPNAAIANTACASNVSTITTTLNPPVGSWVDIQNTDNQHYWGIHQVATTSGSNWTYTDTNCGGLTTIASAATPGGNAREHSAIHDSAQGVTLRDIYFDSPGWATTHSMGSWVVVDLDQGFQMDHVFGGGGTVSTANYVGQAIYAPGPDAPNAAIGFINNLDISMACTGNGIKWLSGNGLTLTNGIIQAVSGFGVVASNIRGGFGRYNENFNYQEVGSCTNPFYVAAGASGSCTVAVSNACGMGGDVINRLRSRVIGGGPGVSGASVGGFPNFATGGGTTYAYWLVIHDGSSVSVPIKFGAAAPTAGTFSVYFPRYASPTGSTVTYDILKTTGVGYNLSAPAANVAQATALTTGLAQCSALICSFSDTQPALSSYTPTIAPALNPDLLNWPGDLVVSGSTGEAFIDDIPTQLIATTPNAPTVYAVRCSSGNPGSYVICPAGTSVGANNIPVGSLLLQEGGTTGGDLPNLTGRLTFLYSPNTSVNSTELITLVPGSTGQAGSIIADPNHRPAANAADAYIGTDGGSKVQGSEGIAYGAPISASQYIGNLPDNINWAERVTAAAKTFKVPVVMNSNLSILGTCLIGCGPFAPGGSQATDNFTRANGALGANWTVTDGTWAILSNTATFTGVGGTSNALAVYTAISFSNNQFASAQIASIAPNFMGVGVRMSNSTNSAYMLLYGGGSLAIFKDVAGTRTNLGSVSYSPVVGDLIRLEANGTTLTAYLNGSPQVVVTDSAFSTGYPGMAGITATGGLDNFAGGDLTFTTTDLVNLNGGAGINGQTVCVVGNCVAGPGVSVVGNLAGWNATDGSALSDLGVGLPLPNSALLNPSVTVNGTVCTLGSSCTPAGGNPLTTLGDTIYGGAAGVQTRLPGPATPNGVPETLASTPSGSAATAPVWLLPGIIGRSVTGTTDIIVSTDCNPQRVVYTGSSAVGVTLPTPTTLAVANCTFKLANNTTNTVTVTPTTWTISAGSGGSTGASLAILAGQEAVIFVDPKTASNWAADVIEQALSGGTGVTLTRTASGVSAAVAGTQITNICAGTVGTSNATAYVFWPAQSSTSTCTATTIPNATNNEIRVGVASTAAHLAVVDGTACTAAGTAVTLYKNGSASALTVALGTTAANTYIMDDTHTVSFAVGDTYSIRIVTGQASETCASLRAVFYLQ